MKIKSHLDFEKNSQILNIKLQQVSSLPTVWAGGLVYLTTDNKVYYGNGTAWIPINSTAGLITGVSGGVGITVSTDGNGVATVTFVPDGSTLEGASASAGAAIRIKDGGVSTVKLADGAVTTIKVTDKNITFAKIQDIPTMTVIGRVTASTGVSSAITILTDLNAVISAHDSLASAKAVKDYVDSVVGGLGNLEGAFDASGTNFPTAVGGTKKGDYWYVTVAGSVQGVALNVGDVLIANKNAASTTLATDWIFLEVNRDQATTSQLGVIMLATTGEAQAMANDTKALTAARLADVKASDAETQTGTATNKFITPANLSARTATEGRTGIAEIATQTEVNAGTDDARIVTPLKLKTYWDANIGVYGRFVGNVGDGSATSIAVTHSLNTRDVKVEVWDNTTFETILCDVVRTSVSVVTLSFAVAPTSGQFRVFVTK